eukprot:365255-Chlamydomonas_euryale.AAC.30
MLRAGTCTVLVGLSNPDVARCVIARNSRILGAMTSCDGVLDVSAVAAAHAVATAAAAARLGLAGNAHDALSSEAPCWQARFERESSTSVDVDERSGMSSDLDAAPAADVAM